jgi:hypothetical protein
MKHLLFAALATVALFSCKKETVPQNDDYAFKQYRVYLTSKSQKDTTYTPTRGARIETVGLDSAFDSKLKAVLLTYNGHGVFTLQVTNLTNCQGIIRWNWGGQFKIDSIGYPSNNPNDPKNDVLHAKETKIFTLYTNGKVGDLKLQMKNQVGDCGNSSELVIKITTTILPIVFLNYNVSYDDVLARHVISFSIEEPKDVDWIIVEQLVGKEYKWVYGIPGDDVTKFYTIKLP